MLAGDPADARNEGAGGDGDGDVSSSGAAGMPWKKYRVVLVAACIGNVLEWYDFALYGGFANEFGQLFFPRCEMEIGGTWLSKYGKASFDELTTEDLTDYCRTHAPDPASDAAPSFVGFEYQQIKNATLREEKCPIYTPTFHGCCLWDKDAAAPTAGLEQGDCIYNPIEPDQLLKSFGTFAGAFIMRPLGGLVMGSIGDKFGRKAALQFSIALMLIPSLLLAALPSYESIGYAATFGLITIRLLQGVAAGGELVGSMLYTVESAPQDKRGAFGALAFSFAIIGTMLGNAAKAVTTLLLSPENVKSYGWRICYVLGFGLGLFGKHLRKDLEESPEFEVAKAELQGENVAPPNPLKEAFTKYYKEVAIVSTSTSIWCAGFYTLMIWIGTFYGMVNDPESFSGFDTQTGPEVDISHPDVITTVQLFWLIICFPIAGHLSDRITTADRRLKVMFGGTAALFVTAVPLFTLMLDNPTTGTAVFMQSCFSMMLSTIGGPMAAWFVEAFPPMVRYSGVGMGYNFGQALFGGPSPFVASYAVSKGVTKGPMYWVCFVACVAMVGLYFARERALRLSDALSSDGMVGAGEGLPSDAKSDFAVAANPTAAAVIASTASNEVIKKGVLKKLGGKSKDKWQDRDVSLSARQLTWDKTVTSSGLQAAEIGSVAVWSGLDMPDGFGFEIASRVKGGKVYKFVAKTEEERDSWMDVIGSLIGDSTAAADLVSESSVEVLQSITLDGRVLAPEGEFSASEVGEGLGETVAPTTEELVAQAQAEAGSGDVAEL